jgi:hypothetical protein
MLAPRAVLEVQLGTNGRRSCWWRFWDFCRGTKDGIIIPTMPVEQPTVDIDCASNSMNEIIIHTGLSTDIIHNIDAYAATVDEIAFIAEEDPQPPCAVSKEDCLTESPAAGQSPASPPRPRIFNPSEIQLALPPPSNPIPIPRKPGIHPSTGQYIFHRHWPLAPNPRPIDILRSNNKLPAWFDF